MIPNVLTILRIFFVPLLVAALVEQDVGFRLGTFTVTNEWLALAIFLSAAATDLLDGYLARRWKQVTTVGTLLDPIADKLLISAALIALVQVRVVPAWIVILIVGREFAVTGLRSIAATAGYLIRASELGKTKMFAQVMAVSMVLVGMHWPVLAPAAMVLIWCVAAVSIVSALAYFRKFWRKVDDGIKRRRRVELLLLEREQKRERFKARRQAAHALEREEQAP